MTSSPVTPDLDGLLPENGTGNSDKVRLWRSHPIVFALGYLVAMVLVAAGVGFGVYSTAIVPNTSAGRIASDKAFIEHYGKALNYKTLPGFASETDSKHQEKDYREPNGYTRAVTYIGSEAGPMLVTRAKAAGLYCAKNEPDELHPDDVFFYCQDDSSNAKTAVTIDYAKGDTSTLTKLTLGTY